MKVRVWRGGANGAFQEFEVPRHPSQTVLDVVTHVQRTLDPTLAYRYACRVGMCGSCAMTVNGVPRWTCRTHVDNVLQDDALTVGPLKNLPIIRDLVTDMTGFFDKWARAKGQFKGGATKQDDFARVPPQSEKRRAADAGIECIGCTKAPERMKRRAILVASGAWLAAAAARAFSQTSKSLRRIGFMHPGTQEGYRLLFDVFRTALKDLGHVEGRDIAITVHWAESKPDRLPSLAAEMTALNPALIVTAGSEAVAALKKATSSIPIVFATVGNPVEQGFVASLRRPGGNITGVALHTGLDAKIVEVIREALPQARRLAILVHDADRYHKIVLDSFEPAARSFNFEPMIVRVTRVEDFERAFMELADRKADALYVPTIGLLTSNRNRIVELALNARVPQFTANPDVTAAGGLLSYGTALEENYRRAAALVDKILRGAKPAELPVDQPERFQLIVNRKTAKAIGVSLSPATMLRADRIID